jgi:hypothetical protein
MDPCWIIEIAEIKILLKLYGQRRASNRVHGFQRVRPRAQVPCDQRNNQYDQTDY